MIKSMTGYGQAKGKILEGELTIEIKALNSKNSDIRIKAPIIFLNKEIELKKLALEYGRRGKLEVLVSLQSNADIVVLDSSVLRAYISELMKVRDDLGLSDVDVMQSALRIPNVMNPKEITISEESWETVQEIMAIALENLNNFREAEGKALGVDLEENIETILEALKGIEKYEDERIQNLRKRMMSHLNEFLANDQVDHNRYEQEVLFYMEKLDINEEKVRLIQHCSYFKEEMKSNQMLIGRKLGFIAQELGREINTIGSKSHHIEIQKLVVEMKDALEKLKEQISNVL